MVLNFNVFVCVLLVITMEVNLFAQNLSINQRKIGSAAGIFFCPETLFSVNLGVATNFHET